ncbi:MAG: alkylphosphonate utilization protein [Cupriavidus sp.]|nr:MAG: alkylphosphonate utilization protein [Cupriavidus sp.]
MSETICPECEMNDVLGYTERWECMTCGHEWPREVEPEAARIVKDSNGNALTDGDRVVLTKDLPLKGAQVLKGGTKTSPIRLVEGDHEISCKIEGVGSVGLKACFVRKA